MRREEDLGMAEEVGWRDNLGEEKDFHWERESGEGEWRRREGRRVSDVQCWRWM